MLIGTFFTLVLLPAIYSVLASDHSSENQPAEDVLATIDGQTATA